MKSIRRLMNLVCKTSLAIGVFSFQTLDAAALLERTVPNLMRRITTHTSMSRACLRQQDDFRRYYTALQGFQPGFYTQATEDPIFKRIMQDDEARNSFLSGIIGENVISSELLDNTLNSVRSYTGLRDLLNSERVVELMEEIKKSKDSFNVIHPITKRAQPKLQQFLKDLSFQYSELLDAFPSVERNTQLDLICQTSTGIINVEVQVDPQDFWDIRILSHVCGLFNRQFPKGFEWSALARDPNIMKKVRRTIGVSIFEKPPVNPDSVKRYIHWYTMVPWGRNELRRHYMLYDKDNPQIIKGGLEFYNYNLAALKYLDTKDVLNTGGVELKEWLELLGQGHMKTRQEVENEVTLPAVKKAYHLIESATLPDNIRKEYEEAQQKRFQISHYVEDEKSKSKAEGAKLANLETAKNMIRDKLSDEIITKYSKLTQEEVDTLRSEYNNILEEYKDGDVDDLATAIQQWIRKDINIAVDGNEESNLEENSTVRA